jgi:hypothetical protein
MYIHDALFRFDYFRRVWQLRWSDFHFKQKKPHRLFLTLIISCFSSSTLLSDNERRLLPLFVDVFGSIFDDVCSALSTLRLRNNEPVSVTVAFSSVPTFSNRRSIRAAILEVVTPHLNSVNPTPLLFLLFPLVVTIEPYV